MVPEFTYDPVLVRVTLRAALAASPAGTQGRRAEALSVSAQTAHRWTAGKARPLPEHWAAIEEHLGLPPGRLSELNAAAGGTGCW